MTEALDRTDTKPATTHTSNLRTAGWVTFAGTLFMLVGAGLHFSAGADAWEAVSSGDTARFLADAGANTTALYAGLTAWVIGVIGMAIGGGLLADAGRGPATKAARTSLTIGAAVAIPAFLVLAALTRLAGAGSVSLELADTLAFLGTTLDDVATIIIIGLSPVLVAIASHSTWMPAWLSVWARLAGVAGVVAVVAIFLGMSGSLGFVIVPVGIGWMVAAGVVAVRRS